MKNKFKLTFTLDSFKGPFAAALLVALLTVVLLFIGKDQIGDAVIALLYLVPITWCTGRWGQVSGIAASITSALVFDYFFIPPYYTLSIANLEGWLILIIFVLVSAVLVGQIQYTLDQTKKSEREAYVMYELVSGLNTLHSREAIANSLAVMIRDHFEAKQTRVSFYPHGNFPKVTYLVPETTPVLEKPNLILTISIGMELAGDISIWKGVIPLPSEKSWVLQSFVRQTAIAIERVEKNNDQEGYPGSGNPLFEGKRL